MVCARATDARVCRNAQEEVGGWTTENAKLAAENAKLAAENAKLRRQMAQLARKEVCVCLLNAHLRIVR